MHQVDLPGMNTMGWHDRELAHGWRGQPSRKPLKRTRLSLAWFRTVQIDWIETLRHALIDKYRALTQRRSQLAFDLQSLTTLRTIATRTPVTQRPTWERRYITQFHVTRAALRKVKRQARDLARKIPTYARHS